MGRIRSYPGLQNSVRNAILINITPEPNHIVFRCSAPIKRFSNYFYKDLGALHLFNKLQRGGIFVECQFSETNQVHRTEI